MKEENLTFILVVGLMLFLFGHNLRGCGEDRRAVELRYYREAIKHIKYGDGKIKENCDSSNTTQIEKKTKKKRVHVVTVTRYNPVKEQCNSDPTTTADNSKINKRKLKNGQLRWVAVSRDLKKKYKYGDKLIIKSDDPSINGVYEIHDLMNSRYTNRVDILTDEGADMGKGLWTDVVVIGNDA